MVCVSVCKRSTCFARAWGRQPAAWRDARWTRVCCTQRRANNSVNRWWGINWSRRKSPTWLRSLMRPGWRFDATMIVMGGIIGAGIFTNPYVVAQQVHTPLLILGAWAVGGLIALAGAFIYAELSSQVTASGGQYVYLRDAMHPLIAFLYGWSLLFVIQTGGMAAVALIFANHLFELIGVRSSEFSAALLGSAALVLLTAINCIG